MAVRVQVEDNKKYQDNYEAIFGKKKKKKKKDDKQGDR